MVSKFLGKFGEVGMDVRKWGKVKFQGKSEGKGSKMSKHSPSLGTYSLG